MKGRKEGGERERKEGRKERRKGGRKLKLLISVTKEKLQLQITQTLKGNFVPVNFTT